jgi:excisionase family DNA binding protein
VPPPKLLLSLPELAEVLGVARASVYRMFARRELPMPILRVGRAPRVRLVDVEEYLERLAQNALAEQERLAAARAIRAPRGSRVLVER